MKKDPLPVPEDDGDRKLLSDIQHVGWHVVVIEEDEEGPGYAFSVGLFHSFDHPEMLLFGLDTTVRLINIIAAQAAVGESFRSGESSDNIIDKFPVSFLTVPANQYRDYLGYALWFYESFDFPVLQCVWPDRSGLFPWEQGYDTRFLQLQPILGIAI